MRPASLLLLFGLLAPLVAQDAMWVANRFSNDVSKVSLCGDTTQTVPLGTNLRSAHVAPDGKIWVVRFIQTTLDLLNADGTTFGTVACSLGNAFDVAFDAAGTAWVSGGAGVENFDANGVSLGTYVLPAANPLGITIDLDGNKWIAHRNGPPGSISRIDGMTGAVTNYAAPAGSNIQHTRVIADFNLGFTNSRIWAVGDSGTTLDEWDSQGNPLNSYPIGAGLSSLATDISGNVWCGSFTTGTVFRVDQNTGMVLSTVTVTPNCLGLAFDGLGRLWATARVTFSGPTPSEVRRIDPATGTIEVSAVVGLGTGSALGTQYRHALVVDPTGDQDLDGDLNFVELFNGSSPLDGQSNSFTNLRITGPSSVGSVADLSLAVPGPTTSTALAVATGLLPSGLSFPGISGLLLVDPTTILGIGTPAALIIPITGPLAFSFVVPPLPGVILHAQGFVVDPAQVAFTNAACLKIF